MSNSACSATRSVSSSSSAALAGLRADGEDAQVAEHLALVGEERRVAALAGRAASASSLVTCPLRNSTAPAPVSASLPRSERSSRPQPSSSGAVLGAAASARRRTARPSHSRIAALGLRRDGPRRHLPADRRLAPRRLDRPRARPAHRRRVALRRSRAVPGHLQRAALLPPRLALAPAGRPPLRPRRRGADRARRAAAARRSRHRGRAGRARDAQRARRGRRRCGAARSPRARSSAACARSSGDGRACSSLMRRPAVRLARAGRAAGRRARGGAGRRGAPLRERLAGRAQATARCWSSTSPTPTSTARRCSSLRETASSAHAHARLLLARRRRRARAGGGGPASTWWCRARAWPARAPSWWRGWQPARGGRCGRRSTKSVVLPRSLQRERPDLTTWLLVPTV